MVLGIVDGDTILDITTSIRLEFESIGIFAFYQSSIFE